MQKAREARRRGHLIKPADNCVQSTLEKRAKKIAERTQISFNNNVKEIYHESDKVMLKAIEFSLNEMDFQVNCGYEQEKKNHQIQSIVKAVDQGQISRCSYRNLAAAEYNLPRVGSVSDECTAITNYMNQIIKISLVDIKKINEPEESIESEEADIVNLEIIQKVIDTMGIGIHRSAKDILRYIIPQLQKQQILKSSDPTIHLRVSGDGRNVGKKIKHVMVTFMILNHEDKHHMPIIIILQHYIQVLKNMICLNLS